MTRTAQTIVLDFGGNLIGAKAYAQRIARAFQRSGQSADAIEYQTAAESINNKLRELEASAMPGSFDLGTP